MAGWARGVEGWARGVAGRRRLVVAVAQSSEATWEEWSGIRLARVGPEALPFTAVHCAGENHSPASWRYRSCEFRNPCLDAATNELVALESREERDLRRAMREFTATELGTITVSTVLDPARSGVSLGTASAEPWFPRVVGAPGDDEVKANLSPRLPQGALVLPESVVLVPFSSVSRTSELDSSTNENVIWDVFYPIYTLLSLFGLEEKQAVLLILDPEESRADATRSRMEEVLSAVDKSTMILAPSVESAIGVTPTAGPPGSWICSKYAVAGLGLRRLDDNEEDAKDRSSRSAAEGINLWAFRTFLMKALRVQHARDLDVKNIPLRVTVHGTLRNHLAALQRLFPAEQVNIHRLDSREDIASTAKTIAESCVFVTSLEGLGEANLGLVTFLPRDSYFLLLVEDVDTYDARSPYGMRGVDWDLLNTAGYFQTRVLPLRDSDASVLASTLRDIVDYVRSEAT